MKTYLFAWNPKKWHWADLEEMSKKAKSGNIVQERWSCARTKKIKTGDRAFLIRLGKKPKGMMASGIVTSDVFEDAHFDKQRAKNGEKANYVEIDWEVILDPGEDELLELTTLRDKPFPWMHWTPQGSGINIPIEVADVLEGIWKRHIRKAIKKRI